MYGFFRKARYVQQSQGLGGLIQAGGRYLIAAVLAALRRPTRKIGFYNGVAVRCLHVFDKTDTFPDYEKLLVAGIREHVRQGECAVVIGGGIGPSTVVTARHVRPQGSVICYEGADERVETIRETIRINGVEDLVEVRHAIVGEAIDLQGAGSSAGLLAASDVPDCDALIMDCEGAEREILTHMRIRPRLIVVETHAHLGSPEEEISRILERLGYGVLTRCTKRDDPNVGVLCAVLSHE